MEPSFFPIYVGKSKNVYKHPYDEKLLIMEFKDDVTAGDGAIRTIAPHKGIINARTSHFFFKLLEGKGLKTHMVEFNGNNKMIVKRLKMIPIEFIARNYAYGSLLKRLPLFKLMQPLDPPLIEFHYKDDSLHDPLITHDDIILSGLLTKGQLGKIVSITADINMILRTFLEEKGLKLVDIKLEYGFDENGEIILADEITGDGFRVVDERGNHLDKEIFRKTKDVKLLIESYMKLASILGIDLSDIK
ncbi:MULTISPECIES: phosphoribosylaminoimidazolesuccinocarboxamide synthase [Fervidicoccus]|jgi:phosphoribosylaminoimidazole-succinocarboxamide synthase|uniref:Phosphoribosylaminoimidazole-succinocarboxamide synthase n=1 Tax=Fervidicoccus fontis TaxID=683846 RepID=A0A7C2VJ47_9CREN|nr:phosphoribosylaminoimidazolesuccinocarboxamide synthase [Fervidicoccus fontis]PMB78150.1 MAG: phosphoribosylaminoimidazolesuccinocarboxamide synthase [Fervidicoccus fontis]HEW64043.1 phosphoribosylaminoimidazolesuccinocarboxamide synthase [Fervidicoccus fontis]